MVEEGAELICRGIEAIALGGEMAASTSSRRWRRLPFRFQLGAPVIASAGR